MSRTPTRRGLFRALAAFAGACGLGVVSGQRPARALTERKKVSGGMRSGGIVSRSACNVFGVERGPECVRAASPGPFPPLYDARCRVDGEFTATFNDSRLYEAVVQGQAELDAEAGKTIADCAARFCNCGAFKGRPKIG